MPNVFISSEIGSEWRTILGHPQLIECIGICVLSLAHVSELTDVYLHTVKKNIWKLTDVYLHIVKKIIWKVTDIYLHIVKEKKSGNFSLKSAVMRAL